MSEAQTKEWGPGHADKRSDLPLRSVPLSGLHPTIASMVSHGLSVREDLRLCEEHWGAAGVDLLTGAIP